MNDKPTAFDLLAAKMEEAKAFHLRALNADLFSDHQYDAMRYAIMTRRPLTWRERMTRRAERVRAYLRTLWLAVRGVELVEPYDDV